MFWCGSRFGSSNPFSSSVQFCHLLRFMLLVLHAQAAPPLLTGYVCTLPPPLLPPLSPLFVDSALYYLWRPTFVVGSSLYLQSLSPFFFRFFNAALGFCFSTSYLSSRYHWHQPNWPCSSTFYVSRYFAASELIAAYAQAPHQQSLAWVLWPSDISTFHCLGRWISLVTHSCVTFDSAASFLFCGWQIAHAYPLTSYVFPRASLSFRVVTIRPTISFHPNFSACSFHVLTHLPFHSSLVFCPFLFALTHFFACVFSACVYPACSLELVPIGASCGSHNPACA